jgi:hypothetical protein
VPESDLQDAVPDFKGMNLLGYQAMAVGNHELNKTRKASGGKRELSGYMKFSRKMRPEILRANPGIEFAAVGKRLGEEWRKLSDAEKKKY